MASTTAGEAAILKLPLELLCLVFSELSFFDLLKCYSVTPEWTEAIDYDDDIRRKMFRLPKKIAAADQQTRRRHVRKLWRELYDQVGKHYIVPRVLWSRIHVNPLFRRPDDHSYGETELFSRGTLAFGTRTFLYIPKSTKLSLNYRRQQEDLFQSMVVTWPPVTHIWDWVTRHIGGL
jgi:hypothetical protein